jgi:dienelactone hydrolase
VKSLQASRLTRLAIKILLPAIMSVGGTAAMGGEEPAWRRWMQGAGTVPELVVPSTPQAWSKQREELRRELWSVLGRLPPRPKLPEVQILGREERDSYVLERFRFDNAAGDRVPGYLVVPKGLQGPAPAVFWCHWHGGEYDNGKEELWRSDHVPEAPGPALAKRGYVVMAIDACCFGERNGQGPGGAADKGGSGEMTASKFNLWFGRTLWGMMLRDDLMALDYLVSRPEVDAARVGVTGISMGATRTWWLMALDERLKAGAAIACLTRYQDLVAAEGLKYHGIYYYVPGMLTRFDTEAVVALIAPRPVLFQTGDQDAGSPLAGIRRIESVVRQVYGLYNAEAQFGNIIYPGVGHDYTPEMWRRTLEWLDRYLRQ